MEKELEVEYKSIVSEDKYLELMGLLAQMAEKKEPYKQVNYFFDTKDFILDRQGITLRLRFKRNAWQLTAKLKTKTEDASYTSNQELNEMITEEKANQYLENGIDLTEPVVQEMLRLANITEPLTIELLGHLTTLRTDFSFYEDTISLDRNYYNERIDFELEWESQNHRFVQFINERSLFVRFNNGCGKRKRFLKSLAK